MATTSLSSNIPPPPPTTTETNLQPQSQSNGNSKTSLQPDLSPSRLQHSSYDFTNKQTAYEVADTLEDHFTLARTNKLSNTQQEAFIRFLNNDNVFRVAVIMVPEVARMAGEDSWVEKGRGDTGTRSAQVAHILHAISHREPRSRRLSRPAETAEDKEELRRRTREIIDEEGGGTDGDDDQATEAVSGKTAGAVADVSSVGDAIRDRKDAGRVSWRERHGGGTA